MAGFKGKKSNFPEVLKQARFSDHYSNFIQNLKTITELPRLQEAEIKENYEFYKQDLDFEKVDAVECAFPSSMCEVFIPLNRSIIFSPAHRFNINRCTLEESNKMVRSYDILKARSKLFVGAVSRYDEEYQLHYSGYKYGQLFSGSLKS